MTEQTKEVTRQSLRIGGYTIVPECGCRRQAQIKFVVTKEGKPVLTKDGKRKTKTFYISCGKPVKIPNALFDANPSALWFRKNHDPRFRNKSVSFQTPLQ